MKRVSAVMALVLGCALALTGCAQGPERERVTDTDRQRLQVLLDEPIIRNSQQDISKQPGTLLPGNTLKRGFVTASVFSAYPDQREQPLRPGVTKRRTAAAVASLRDAGWAIASASCTPPDPEDPVQARRWEVTAYKYVEDVGYWANLTGAAVRSGPGFVDVALRAPNADDPPDLVGHPAGLAAGSTCVEQRGLSDQPVRQGTPAQLPSSGPRPGSA